MTKEISANSEIYASLMTYLLSRRRTDIVFAFSEKALHLDANCKDGYHYKALALSNSKLYEEALEFIELGLQRFPKDRDLLRQKSGIYLNKQNFEESVKILKQIMDEHPKDGEVMFQIAQLLDGALGRCEEAIGWYERAAESKLKSERSYLLMGEALIKFKKYKTAAKSFRKASKINPEHAYYLYKVACAEASAENEEKALKYLGKAIKLDPEKFIEAAKNTEEFESLRKSRAFKQLIG